MHTPEPVLWSGDPPLRVHRVTTPEHPCFEAAYALLASFFAEKGQIESREQTARLLAVPWTHQGLRCSFPMVYAEDLAGQPVAVAQRYVVFDPEERLRMGLDGSVFCAPTWRGRGLALRLSSLLLEDAEPRARRVVDLGDLEPVTAADPDSARRARLWGRQGYRLLPPEVFPLRLCGMEGDGVVEPVPMWAIMRLPGEDPAPATVSRALLRRLAQGLEAAHCWSPDASDYTPALLAAIDAGPDPVPLLPL